MTLVHRLVRAIPWITWVPSTALLALILWGMSSLPPDFASRQLYLRAALLVAALGLSFSYDDTAAETTDSAPSPLRRRRAIRTLLGIAPWGALVAATGLVAGRGMEFLFILSDKTPNALPVGRILLEASTIAVWGLAFASVTAKRWDDEPGKYASAALLVLYAVSWTVPEQWKPWANPNDPRWETALSWWWVTFAIGLLIAIAFSWDSRVGWRLRYRRGKSNVQSGRVDPYSVTSGKQ